MVTATPLDGAFGAEITDVDLAAGHDQAIVRPIIDALYAHRLIVIRGQTLSKNRYLEFGRAFGQPIPHVLDYLRMPGYPEMLAEIKAHALQDRFVMTHDYRVGDIAVWDTGQTLHRGPDIASGEDDARLLYRISVRGKPPIYQ